MGIYVAGILTGILISMMVQLVRCAAWFEMTHPEDDYWHRGIWKKSTVDDAQDKAQAAGQGSSPEEG